MFKDLRQSPSSKSSALVTVRGQREKRTNPADANNQQAVVQKVGAPQPLLFSSSVEVSELSLGRAGACLHDNNQIIDGCYAPEKPRYPYPAKLDINGLITFLSENPTIRQLDLSTHRLSVENIRDLCEYLTYPDCQVIELNLYQTGLTDTHLNIFSGMLMKEHSLKVLRVGGNHRLTLEAVQLFEKQLSLYDHQFILFDWDYFNYDLQGCCCFKKKKGKKLNKEIKKTTTSNWEKMTLVEQQTFSTGGCLSEATRSMLPQVSNAYAVSPSLNNSSQLFR